MGCGRARQIPVPLLCLPNFLMVSREELTTLIVLLFEHYHDELGRLKRFVFSRWPLFKWPTLKGEPILDDMGKPTLDDKGKPILGKELLGMEKVDGCERAGDGRQSLTRALPFQDNPLFLAHTL
jgi:hypothetical protein